MIPIVSEFQGEHRFLSNFWPAPVKLFGWTFPTVEHAYQAAKAGVPHAALFHLIRGAVTPGVAKRIGRGVALPADWDQRKLAVMRDLLVQKFAPGSPRAADLLKTGRMLLQEGNRWGDRFWGVDLRTGEGQNHLGRLLMEVRAELQSAPSDKKSLTAGDSQAR